MTENEKIAEQCRARERYERDTLSIYRKGIREGIENEQEKSKAIIETKDKIIAEKDKSLAEKDKSLAEKDKSLAEQRDTIADLTRQLEELKEKVKSEDSGTLNRSLLLPVCHSYKIPLICNKIITYKGDFLTQYISLISPTIIYNHYKS